jgi:AcrR family transcriptional regulator
MSATQEAGGTVDGRRLRGDRTRQAVAQQAAALASVDGLAGMTLSQVADALGVSKSSVQAAFKTKEELQLATIAAATDVFVNAVVRPALAAVEGLPRLRALADAWLDYVEKRVFPGGCFMVATLSEFDSRPGPVRDALATARQGWLALLEHQASVAQSVGDLPPSPAPSLVAFEVDALLSSANVDRNLSDDTSALDAARALLALRLGSAAPAKPARRARGSRRG